ncbi:MAG: AAA family ATPase, partial [Clostridia bacterium]|nr:AAA family ATPase [Clostridia bacterium]
VDKSMFIYELLHNGGQNNLITRPRRFGKTLNFSMLKYFFDITEKDNAYLFDGLKISEYYDELAMYRNTHPVITLSLKCAKQGDYDDALYSLCHEIQGQFIKYSFIMDSERINIRDNEAFKTILNSNNYDERIFKEAVKLLCSCLKQYYGANTIILIDEYDVPLEDAYFSGYYDKMVRFIRSLFESALKTNPALEFSVITGCLRISKESIFTGLNNLKMNTILSVKYSEYFGFEEYEVVDLLNYYGLENKIDIIKKWYDGYLFGKTEIYNPWSIMYYVDDLNSNPDEFPKTNWINTSSNNIIRTLIEQSDDATKSVIERLIHGGSVETRISETITYGDLTNKNENIWSFLLFTGYLRINKLLETGETTGNGAVYSLIIPNMEIKSCYKDIIMQYFDAYKKEIDKDDLYKSLLSGDAVGFANPITKLLKSSISFYDNTESFYHGLVSGLLAGNTDYEMKSNRETGDGRSDLILYQRDKFINAVIIEFKICRDNEEIDAAADRALRQINEMDYAAEAREKGYRNILKYGVAFKNKICYAVAECEK